MEDQEKVDYLSGYQGQSKAKEIKKAKYSIRNVRKKDLSRTIMEFDKLPYKSYERRRPKHEPTDSYFYLSIQISKYIMRADVLNSHVYPVRNTKYA